VPVAAPSPQRTFFLRSSERCKVRDDEGVIASTRELAQWRLDSESDEEAAEAEFYGPNADFAAAFDTSRIAHVFHKGVERNIDSYSTFFDNAHRRETGLADYLKKRSIKDIYLMGLALDYCVKYSVLDARQLGLNTHVILDGCRGIELEPGDIDRALDEMKRVGAVLLKSSEL